MQKVFLSFLLFCLVMTVHAQSNFEVLPKKPTPGSVITIKYVTKNSPLQGKGEFDAVAYLMEGKLPLARPIVLKKADGVYTGTVKTNDSTKAVFFSFSKDETFDNNNDEGFYTLMYDKKGAEVLGSNLNAANAFNSYSGIWNLKRNADKATEFYKKEFSNPAATQKFAIDYVNFLSRSKETADKDLMVARMQEMVQQNAREEDLSRIKYLYESTLKDKSKADEVHERIKQLYPNGSWKRSEAFATFNKEKGLTQREKLLNAYLADFGRVVINNSDLVDRMATTLATQTADSGDYASTKKYLAMINNTVDKARALNSIAWKMTGGGINNKPIDTELGKELSLQSLAMIQQEMKEQKSKNSYMTSKEYAKNLEGSLHSYSDTYATLLFQSGELDKAYAIEKKAVDHFKKSNTNLNQAFAVMTEKVKGPEAAKAELELFIEDGKYTPAMKDQLKRIYLATGNNEEQWVSYSNSVEQRAYNKLKAELLKKMINKPATGFSLKDMEGNEVSLAALKGKIVVVDFWATWCGPCIASFPGMQKAQDDFKNSDDVVFLFINTWETGDDREKKVKDFVAKNKYTFRILYDETKSKEDAEFQVIKQFEVDGIPTKFIIDRNGNIRFKSVGYNGSTDALVTELKAMIDLAAAESGAPLKKAF